MFKALLRLCSVASFIFMYSICVLCYAPIRLFGIIQFDKIIIKYKRNYHNCLVCFILRQ